MLSGSTRYVALDAIAHADSTRNLYIYDALVELFRRQADIPGPTQFPGITLALPDSRFPRALLPPSHMPFFYDWLPSSRGLLQPWTTLPARWISRGTCTFGTSRW